jgi:hypothetical protein
VVRSRSEEHLFPGPAFGAGLPGSRLGGGPVSGAPNRASARGSKSFAIVFRAAVALTSGAVLLRLMQGSHRSSQLASSRWRPVEFYLFKRIALSADAVGSAHINATLASRKTVSIASGTVPPRSQWKPLSKSLPHLGS